MMKFPQLVIFTNLKMPGRPISPIAVRADTVVVIERTTVKLEEKITKGISTVKTNLPGAAMEGTCLYLGSGGQLFIEESVEEATAAIRSATRGWFR